MKVIAQLVIFLILVITSNNAVGGLINSSHTIFLSRELQKQIGDYQSFPAFWWNFLVRDISTDNDWTETEAQCQYLKNLKDLVSRIECQQNLKDYSPLIKDWARDFPLRSPRPDDSQFRKSLDSALSFATLPLSDRSLLDVFRLDPFETWKVLKSKADAKLKMNLLRKNGFFFDQKNSRVVIPIQMTFSPSESKKTDLFVKELVSHGGQWYFIGPHGSHLQNQSQVISDVHQVSYVGTVLLFIFGLSLFFLKKARVFFLVIPVATAMVISFFVTILVFGSIHGLTLSFGTAIVGLALDYGLQAAFNSRSPHLWRANLFGILTTLVGLFVLMTSTMPLLQQMMVFSSVGLCCAFAFIFLIFKVFPEKLEVTPLNILPHPNTLKTVIAGILVVSSFVSIFVLKPTMDMSRFNYQEAKTFEVTKWLFTTLNIRAPLFDVTANDTVLLTSHKEKDWAEKNKIDLENLASYVPDSETQKVNISTWNTDHCRSYEGQLSSNDKRFFEPFINEKLCETQPLDFSSREVLNRSYLTHLNSGVNWLTMWLPKTDEEELKVRKAYPNVVAIKDIVSEIPLTLARELRWMAPLSIFLAFCFLFFYYRNFMHTFSALIPFLTGMGLVSLCIWLFNFDVSFVSIIGLVMVFGFSIDYGIFATDLHRGLRGQADAGVWTGLSLAVLTTCAGFVPLLFCKHPILLSLGQALFYGAVGTFIGAIWGIPGFFYYLKKTETR